MTCRGHNDHSAHCKPNKPWRYTVATSMIRGRVAGSCFTLTKTNQHNSCHEGIVLERKRLTIGLRHSVSERAVRVFLAWGVGSLPKTLRKAIPKGKRKESRIPTIHLSGAKMLVLGMVTTILLFQECHRIATHQHWKKSQDLAVWRKKRMIFSTLKTWPTQHQLAWKQQPPRPSKVSPSMKSRCPGHFQRKEAHTVADPGSSLRQVRGAGCGWEIDSRDTRDRYRWSIT